MAVDTTDLRTAIATFAGDAFDQATRDLLDDLRSRVPVKTGRLDRSGKIIDRRAATDVVQATVVFDAAGPPQYGSVEYASFTDTGSRPHIIRARPGKVLAFEGRDGEMVFRPWVQHPGTTGTRWFSGTVTVQNWTQLLVRALDTTASP